MNILKHSILKQACEVTDAIELCGASTELSNAVIKSTDLAESIDKMIEAMGLIGGDKMIVDTKDLDYTLNELRRYRKETLKLRRVKQNYDRLVKMTDVILDRDGCQSVGEEYGPVQVLEKAVSVKKAELEL